MAKVAKEKSPAAKALEVAREKLAKAKEMLAKQDNATNKKAVEAAQAEVAKQAAIVNRERFEDVAGTRLANFIKVGENLINCASPRSYKFEATDVQQLEEAVDDIAKRVKAAFRAGLNATNSEAKASGAKKFVFGQKA